MLDRRQVLGGMVAAVASGPAWAAEAGIRGLTPRFQEIEAVSGGRLGVAVLDTQTGLHAGYRADERFPMCSTFKLLAAGAVLARADEGAERLDRVVPFGRAELVAGSPVTEKRAGRGMPMAEVCAAAIQYSDNTAGNLMLASLGGPAGLTRFLRSLGDSVSRLDRTEPTLNEALPNDPRDTTTPGAMTMNLQTLSRSAVLSEASRRQLIAWLLGNTTGGARIKAGLPSDWQVGDKTGTGERGASGDVAIIWPTGRAPVLLSVYVAESESPLERRNGTIAAVGRAVAGVLV